MAKKRIDMGHYMADNKQRKAMQWCINNGIKISPFAHNTYEWYIDTVSYTHLTLPTICSV